MDETTKCSLYKTRSVETCIHHWVIESPSETTSKGVCKHCGCEREFVNSFAGLRAASSRQKSEEEHGLAEA